MIPRFTAVEKAIHYPKDMSFYVRIKPYILFIVGAILLGSIVIAWLQYLICGLPQNPSVTFSTGA